MDNNNKKRKKSDEEQPDEPNIGNKQPDNAPSNQRSSSSFSSDFSVNPPEAPNDELNYQFVYHHPRDRSISNLRHYVAATHLPRVPNVCGFAMFDRVLIVDHESKDYTGMINDAGSENNRNVTVVMDHLDVGEPTRQRVVPMECCLIVPYPFHEKEMKIRYRGFSYLQYYSRNGHATVKVVEQSRIIGR